MKKILLAAAMFFLFLSVGSTYAMSVTCTPTTCTVTYDEPTTNTDGSLLTSFDHVNAFVNGAKITTTYPASKPTGGGLAQKAVIPAVTAGKVTTFYLTAVNANGKESVPSNTLTWDDLTPNPPK